MILALTLLATLAQADDGKSVQPYIDSLKKSMPAEKTPSEGSYSEYLRSKLPPDPNAGKSYIQQLQETDPNKNSKSNEPYLDKERARLGPAKNGGAIQAVKDGKSDLELKREGDVHYSAGFRMGASATRSITATAAASQKTYDAVYGSSWTPDLGIYFEYQPIRRWWGNLGLMFEAAGSFKTATGKFEFALKNPKTGNSFGSDSMTKFRFITIPVALGGRYTLPVGKYLQPFAYMGVLGVYYEENRSDVSTDYQGMSRGIESGAGVNVLLDFLTTKTTADLYTDYKIHAYYLTVEYEKIQTFSDEVDFSIGQVSVGLSYEF